MVTRAAQGRSSRQAWRAARVRVGGQLIASLSDKYHGRRSTYSYYGCRCDRCRDANRAAAREQQPAQRPAPSRTPEPVSSAAPEPAPSPAPAPAAESASPKPAPPPERAAPEPAPKLPSDPIPAFSTSAADHVTSRTHLELVLEAYHRPVIVPGVPDRPDLETRIAEGCLIRVRSETGEIVFVGDAERSSDEPTFLAPTQAPKRRKRGGSGSRLPTSMREIRTRLVELECTLDDAHWHTRVTLPNGRHLQIPKTPSDGRSIRNLVSQFRDSGLDLRRDAS